MTYVPVRSMGAEFGAVMPTFLEFLNDPYRIEAEATIVSRRANRVTFDRTIFYPATGTSLPDSGEIVLENGRCIRVRNSQWHDAEAEVMEHICEQSVDDLILGDKLTLRIDWLQRYAAMRIQTALYLVSVAFPYPVVTASVDTGWGQITFEVDDTGMHADELERLVDRLVDENLPVQSIWISRSSQVQKTSIPPIIWPGANGQIRALRIGEFNVRPSDGLHVRHTAEVGHVQVTEMNRLADNILSCDIRLLDEAFFP